MKVLFLSQIVPWPPHGGVLQRGFNIVREISRFAEVHLLAYIHPDVFHPPFTVKESRRVLGDLCKTVEYFDLWPKRSKLDRAVAMALSAVSPLPFSVIAHRSKRFSAYMNSVLERENIDLIHFDTIALSQFFVQGAKIPQVLTHHNVESSLMKRRSAQERSAAARYYVGREAQKLEAYEVRECARFDMNITVSEADALLLQEMVPSLPASVVPNGVDVEYFKPFDATGAGSPGLIYTGGMNMFANRDAVTWFLQEMWPLIKDEVPDVQFNAVGQDPPPEITALAQTEPGLHLPGFVDDVRPLINDALVYVVPLRVGGGTRLKILDAMAMGKAIVSTSIGCEGIQAVDGENIVLADDPASFAAKTVQLLRDRGERERIGQAARRFVEEKYSWETIGKGLQEIYETLNSQSVRNRA